MTHLVHREYLDGLPEDALFLDGHFPGNPIVPGAVLIGLASHSLREEGYEITSILRMKFMSPLPPAQPFEIDIQSGEKSSTLRIVSKGQTVADARVIVQAIRD